MESSGHALGKKIGAYIFMSSQVQDGGTSPNSSPSDKAVSPSIYRRSFAQPSVQRFVLSTDCRRGSQSICNNHINALQYPIDVQPWFQTGKHIRNRCVRSRGPENIRRFHIPTVRNADNGLIAHFSGRCPDSFCDGADPYSGRPKGGYISFRKHVERYQLVGAG